MTNAELSKFGEIKKQLAASSGSWLVGVSGGVDSMVLLDVMVKSGLKPVVAHVNYGTRGKHSDADEELVRSVCDKIGLEFYFKRIHKDEMYGNFQERARILRYRFFEEIYQKCDCDWIATAHNYDDQLETILMRVLQGRGPAAWGMTRQRGHIIRPMLEVSRKEIEAYAAKHNVKYRTDSSNLTPEYLRNRIRLRWMPEIREHIPGADSSLLRLRKIGSEYREMAEWILNKIIVNNNELCRNSWMSQSPKVQVPVLAAWIESHGLPVTTGITSLAENLSELQTGAVLELSVDHGILRNRDSFVLTSLSEHESEPDDFLLNLQELKKSRVIVTRAGKLNISTESYKNGLRPGSLQADTRNMEWPLKLRLWKEGDKIRPLGMQGKRKKISDLLTDAKIDAGKKKSAYVLESFDGNLVAVIFPQSSDQAEGVVAETYKCGPDTEQVITIALTS